MQPWCSTRVVNNQLVLKLQKHTDRSARQSQRRCDNILSVLNSFWRLNLFGASESCGRLEHDSWTCPYNDSFTGRYLPTR